VNPFGEETNLFLEIDPQNHRLVAVLSTASRLQTKKAVDVNILAHLASQHTHSVGSSDTKLRKIVCATSIVTENLCLSRVEREKNVVCHEYRDRKIVYAASTVTEKLCVPRVP
jgi:hypothetical protein